MKYLLALFTFSLSLASAQEVPIYGNADIFGATYVRDSLKVDSSVTFTGLGGTGTGLSISAGGRLSKVTPATAADSSQWSLSVDTLLPKGYNVKMTENTYIGNTNNDSLIGDLKYIDLVDKTGARLFSDSSFVIGPATGFYDDVGGLWRAVGITSNPGTPTVISGFLYNSGNDIYGLIADTTGVVTVNSRAALSVISATGVLIQAATLLNAQADTAFIGSTEGMLLSSGEFVHLTSVDSVVLSSGISNRLILNDDGAVTKSPSIIQDIGVSANPWTKIFADSLDGQGADLDSFFILPRLTDGLRDAMTPIEGMMIYNTSHKVQQTYEDGAWISAIGVLFNGTADATVANTVVETTILPSGIGTLTLPANFFTVGKSLVILMKGYISDTGNPTLNARIKLGATTLISTGAFTLGSISNDYFEIEAEIVCRSVGVTGTVVANGEFTYENANSMDGAGMITTGTTTINTTGSLVLDVTVEWGTASASNTITTQICTIEELD